MLPILVVMIGLWAATSLGAQPASQPRAAEPLIIDLRGNGVAMTSPDRGVLIDIDGDGAREQVSWTTSNGDDAILCLDYNKNGRIDVPFELIGGTLGPPNAFDLLSAVDGIISRGRPERVASRRPDGYIDSSDAIYADLILWVDSNGNAVSEDEELQGLQHASVVRLSVARDPLEVGDSFGNRTRSRGSARLVGTAGGPFDVEMVTVSLARQ